MKAYNIKGVEIFSVGEWNGDNFNQEDVNGMATAFNETKLGIQPYLKLGHSKKQVLAQNDGLPSLGNVDNMYTQGEKLLADFVDVPKKVYDLMKIGAYKKRSVEMFYNVKIKGKKFSHLITAVSLLGADTPAVMNLSDIHALYFESDLDPKNYEKEIDFKFNELNVQEKEVTVAKTELEIKLEQDLADQKKEFTAQKEKNDQLAADLKAKSDKEAQDQKEIKDLKEFKANAEKKQLEDAQKLAEEQVKSFTTALIAEKLASPAMVPLIEQLLSDKKEFSVKAGDKELKTKQEIFKEALNLFSKAKDVNFKETTETTTKTFSDKEKAQDELDKKARQFMADDKKLKYKDALIKAKKEA